MRKNWILFFEIVALGALFLAPLSLIHVDSELLFPYITSKNFMWRLAIGVAFAAWASLALLNTRYRFNWRNPVFLALSGWMCVMLLANTLGIDPHRSFWSNAERMDGYIGLLHMYLFFITILGVAQKRVVWKSLMYLMIGLGVLLGLVALGQESERADAWLGNPIYLASFSSFALFASALFMMGKQELFSTKWVREIFFGLLVLFFTLIIFETGTRGAVLGLMFGGLTAALLVALTVRSKEDVLWRRLGALGCIVVVISVCVFFASKEYIKEAAWAQDITLLQRAADFSLEDTTTKHRLANWSMAIEGFQERPLLGWGQENYIHVFSKHYRAAELYDAEQWFDRTHNMFLDWLVFGGVFGLGTFVILLITCFWTLWRKTGDYFTNTEKSVVTGTVVGYMAQNFVAFDALATGMWITLFMAVIALGYQAQHKDDVKPLDIERYVYLLPIAWIFVGVWLYGTWWEPRESLKTFMSLYQPLQANVDTGAQYQSRYENVEWAMNNRTFFNQEFTEQLLSRHNLYANERVPVALQGQFVKLVTEHAQEQIKDKPFVTRLHTFYGNFLFKAKNYNLAQQHFTKALETSPEKLTIMWDLGAAEIARGNTEAGLGHFENAATLVPQYERAQTIYEQRKQAVSQAASSGQ